MRTPSNFGRLLGELEHEVMQVLWRSGESLTIRNVVDVLQRERNLAYTTVMTIMGRLTAKGLLIRDESRQPHAYKTRYSQEELYRSLAGTMLARIRKEFGDVAIACFVDEAEKAGRTKLKKLIRELKAREE
ncbi:MAG: BlaI/MecI/CopY family transcriptional regulator [Patescibacteria group bacterium]